MKLQLLWLALVFIAVETNAAKQGKNATIPALIVFGDSIMDTGNNNRLPTLLKCNFPPYGKDFPGGLATGRFSDGRVPSDLIAEKLGIAKSLPAFMNPNLKPQDLLKGVTFASGGTGYDPLTAKIMSVISVWDQLTYFKRYISTIKQHFGEKKAQDILDHSFFVVCSSSNDLAHTFMAQSHKYDRTSYPNFLADSAVKFVRELHKLGAKKIGVFSAVPVGCVPLQRTVFGGMFTRGYKELDGVILYIDVYDTLYDMIQHPSKYGFEVADRGCCGRGSLAISYMCNSLNPFTCSNSSAYIFWDSYHPTERAYQVIVDNLLDKYLSKIY
ncbi:BnaA09g15550D [Brassica napus]|uniref:BnaA09g15550D protein n=1 Tax=Brassica napus TaxID=3708 RepID=A0A078HV73_BRANA|nr:BnaA09g15550D [Brassica napus]